MCALAPDTIYFAFAIIYISQTLLTAKCDMSALPTRYVLRGTAMNNKQKGAVPLRTRYILPCQRIKKTAMCLTAKCGGILRHSAANQNHILLLRRVTFIGILHCCEAYQECSGTILPFVLYACLCNFKQRRRQPLHFAVRYNYRVRSRRTFLSLFAFVRWRRTYRVGAADISLLRGSYVRLSLTYIRAKISRPERHGTLSLIAIAVPRRT